MIEEDPRATRREMAGRLTDHLPALVTIADGAAAAASHPGLAGILVQIPMLISCALWWSVQRRHQRIIREDQRQRRELLAWLRDAERR